MAAEQAAVRCTLERLRCLVPSYAIPGCTSGVLPGHVRLGEGQHTRARWSLALCHAVDVSVHTMPKDPEPRLTTCKLAVPVVPSQFNRLAHVAALPLPQPVLIERRLALSQIVDRPRPLMGYHRQGLAWPDFCSRRPSWGCPGGLSTGVPDGRFCKGPLAVHMADGMTRRPVALAPDA